MCRAFIKAALLGLIIPALSPVQAEPHRVRYACAGNEQLIVERNGSKAHVSLAGRGYDLERRHSSIGDKYLSQDAALIIDGASALFVAEDRIDLGACSIGVPVASAR